jgi:hypothetical protein
MVDSWIARTMRMWESITIKKKRYSKNHILPIIHITMRDTIVLLIFHICLYSLYIFLHHLSVFCLSIFYYFISFSYSSTYSHSYFTSYTSSFISLWLLTILLTPTAVHHTHTHAQDDEEDEEKSSYMHSKKEKKQKEEKEYLVSKKLTPCIEWRGRFVLVFVWLVL